MGLCHPAWGFVGSNRAQRISLWPDPGDIPTTFVTLRSTDEMCTGFNGLSIWARRVVRRPQQLGLAKSNVELRELHRGT